jgi:hypothetical protein
MRRFLSFNLQFAICNLQFAILAGCITHTTPPTKKEPYSGPTQSLADVVAEINANNERLTTLWARHYYEATVFDEKKKSHFVNGDGVVQYRRPYDMRLTGDKPAAGRIFDLGSNETHYWFTLVPEVNTRWWGKYEHLGKPCVDQSIPIRPDLVMEVLGVGHINTNFLEEPAPVMRFNNDADAYMFVWNVRLRDRWVAQKEIWYDRKTKLPKLVLLFDENGRIVLRAYLTKHKPVDVGDDNVPQDARPVIATDFRLFFPDTGTKMTLELADIKLQHKGWPKEASFSFDPTQRSGDDTRDIQIDEKCDDE